MIPRAEDLGNPHPRPPSSPLGGNSRRGVLASPQVTPVRYGYVGVPDWKIWVDPMTQNTIPRTSFGRITTALFVVFALMCKLRASADVRLHALLCVRTSN